VSAIATVEVGPSALPGAAMAEEPQYTLPRVLGIWAAAALPMGVLGWVVAPGLAPDLASNPVGAVVARFGALTAGLVWLHVLSLMLVRREEGNLRWATIRRRLRLNAPRDPRTDEPRGRLWLWVIPLVVLIGLWQALLGPRLTGLWVSVLPFLAEPPGLALGTALA